MAREIMSFVIIIGALMFLGTFQTGLEEASRTYSGEETFDTIEEAFSFQEDVVNEAMVIEAEIRECNLTKQSPPTISFIVVSPAIESSWLGSTPTQFSFGERVRKSVKWDIIGYITFVAILTTMAMLLIWTKRGNRLIRVGKETNEKDK